MEFCLLDSCGKKKYRQELLEILEENDNAFVPPLSQRTNTTQTALQGNTVGSIALYLNGVMEQKILAMLEGEKLLGFVSFRENFVSDAIGEENLPNIYISTLVVRADARGLGLTKKAYTHLFASLYPDRRIFTRTWSSNNAHIKILGSFGFSEFKRICDDRGAGIDTVYFQK
jgi:ribosomal protein S18 acetylase RimI-like enzyme